MIFALFLFGLAAMSISVRFVGSTSGGVENAKSDPAGIPGEAERKESHGE